MKKTESKEQKLGPQCYRNYMTLAVRLYLEKKYTQAIHFFGEALDLSPGNKHCLVARSKCYLKEGRPDKALQDTELALQSDSAFPDAVLQKAESYFQQSNFEAALVHFHRGVQFQVKQEMFIKGVYKCEEAILNAVRWLDKVKKKIGEETTDEDRTDTKKSEDKNMTSVFVFENDSTLPSEEKMWVLLAELYEDKKFLQNVLRKIDCRREHGWLSKLVVINQIVYFNNQSKFLLAKMPVIERLKQGARSKLGDDLLEINRIYKAKKFRECIDKCVNILNTYSTKELGSKQRHLAEVYSLIGACYLEKKTMEEARIIYINLLAIGDALDDNEITLNAVSGLVVTYNDDKEYQMFVDAGETDNVGISELQEMWFNYRLGFFYLGVNNEIAKKYINMCLDCAETGMNKDYITHSLVVLACAHVRTKNNEEALKAIETCYTYFKEEITDNSVAVQNVLDLLTVIVKEEICEEEERLTNAAREKEEADRLKKEMEAAAALAELEQKSIKPPDTTITGPIASNVAREPSGMTEATEATSFITETEETSFITEKGTSREPSVIDEKKKALTEKALTEKKGEPSATTGDEEQSFITGDDELSFITVGDKEKLVLADLEEKEPELEGKEPELERKEPDLEGKEPELERKEPELERKEPDLEGKEPDLEEKVPDLEGKEPSVVKDEEAVPTEEQEQP